MNKVIGMFAHVDAGKTTLAEQILYHTEAIRKAGRVDHKDSFLDNNFIEKERGITIFSGEARFTYKGDTYYLLDTPGHIDFAQEMERTLWVMDYAILVISAAEGVQAHTETLWYLLKDRNIPVFIFINKVDRSGADVDKVMEDIKKHLTRDALFIKNDIFEEEPEDDIIESIAEKDEELLKIYFDGGYEKELWLNKARDMVKNRRIFPCFSGSALQDIGIQSFINSMHNLTSTSYSEEGAFKARVYKIRHDDNGMRMTYMKSLGGRLSVKDEVSYMSKGEEITEKINELRYCNGLKSYKTDSVKPGELFIAYGLSRAVSGQGIGGAEDDIMSRMVPALTSKVIFDKKLNPREVLRIFKILEDEDSSLGVIWSEELQEIQIHVMGSVQLEILKEILKERFSLDVEFGKCEVLYKETIKNEAVGRGHFEPLRHYAEVHMKMEPAQRGSGLIFESRCHVDDLAVNYQKLIKSHIFEREHRGILTGSPITDIKFILIGGRSHIKHTEGGDFRQAAFRAMRQGLEKGGSILLEPYYKFRIQAAIENMGRIISDVQKMCGTFETPETFEDRVIIEGRGPVKTFMDYPLEFISFTKGRGTISMLFDGYDICHNSEEVIEEKGYNKDADIEYTSSSVFCSHGQGFIVDGAHSDEYMHWQENR